jgi:hypothetical protein
MLAVLVTSAAAVHKLNDGVALLDGCCVVPVMAPHLSVDLHEWV